MILMITMRVTIMTMIQYNTIQYNAKQFIAMQ